jgi:uncharacterized membrane protein required for colicin V production
MAVVGCVVIAVALGWMYMGRGLFRAARLLITALLSTMVGISFGPAIANVLDFEARWIALIVPTVTAFVVIMVLTAQIIWDDDVDFHPLVDRIGGGLVGAAAGFLIGGYASTVLIAANIDSLRESQLEKATAFMIEPSEWVAQFSPGQTGGRYEMWAIMGWPRPIDPAEDDNTTTDSIGDQTVETLPDEGTSISPEQD